ncbi:MAG TPA: M20/M25/M40 family metallo-hydrolase [Gemmatimonadaceae bacterium]|nr:M20/M25/M40 family metallo-hydrolase [Gemmatimonadaceae bacterium]
MNPHTHSIVRELSIAAVLALLGACAHPAATTTAAPAPAPASAAAGATQRAAVAAQVTDEDVRSTLYALADDSMQGRFTASPGGARAARYIASRMQAIGLRPAGDSGFFQRVPVAIVNGYMPRALESFAAWDTLPADRRGMAVNVVGVLPGELADSAIVVDAHYDHLGVVGHGTCRTNSADSICNGADDDASGATAVLEIAKAMASAPRPRRTIVFVTTTGEEVGLIGTRWYIAHPVVPLSHMTANLEIEMIDRPDSLAGGPGHAWLTGYDRSSMGDFFAVAGLPIVPDARPCQGFFERSDNIAFARAGIPAHTLSTFDLHADYHRVNDEPSLANIPHMTAVIRAAAQAVDILANGPTPQWYDGRKPAATGRLPLAPGCSPRR